MRAMEARKWPDGAARFPDGPVGSGGGWLRADQAFLIAEMSNSSLIFSETRTPPVSSAAFQVRPQSLRLMVVAPSKPTRMLPNGSWAEPVYSKSTVTGLVTPLMVRSPVIGPVVAVARRRRSRRR